MAIDIHVSRNGAASQVVIAGELTIYSVAEAREALHDILVAGSEVDIDLAQITEIDSAGLQWMLAAKSLPDTTLRYVGHAPVVQQIVELANLAQRLHDPIVMPLHDTAFA